MHINTSTVFHQGDIIAIHRVALEETQYMRILYIDSYGVCGQIGDFRLSAFPGGDVESEYLTDAAATLLPWQEILSLRLDTQSAAYDRMWTEHAAREALKVTKAKAEAQGWGKTLLEYEEAKAAKKAANK